MFGFAKKSSDQIGHIPTTEAAKAFEIGLKSCDRKIEFEPRWRDANGWGYRFEGFVNLSESEMVYAIDAERKVRIILIGTFFGPVAIYDTYENGRHNGFWPYFPTRFPTYLQSSLDIMPKPSAIGVRNIVGDGEDFVKNIGYMLKSTFTTYRIRVGDIEEEKRLQKK